MKKKEYWDNYLEDVKLEIKKMFNREYIYCDLHIHSNYSADGKQNLEEIIKFASKCGLDVISITDHDNLDVYDELAEKINYFKQKKISIPVIIPGVEYTVDFDGYSSRCHILKYFINPYDAEIRDEIDKNKKAYWNRAEKHIECMHNNMAIKEIFRENELSISIEEFKDYLIANYEIPIPEYITFANYIYDKINKKDVTVEDIIEKMIYYNRFDECLERKKLKNLAIERLINKKVNLNTSEVLMRVLAIPSIDDELYKGYQNSGNLSVNKFGQIKINDMCKKGVTVFAHPNENKINIIKKFIQEERFITGIELNKRNNHCSKEKIIETAKSMNIFYTIGSDDHGEHQYTYEEMQFYRYNIDEFKKFFEATYNN